MIPTSKPPEHSEHQEVSKFVKLVLNFKFNYNLIITITKSLYTIFPKGVSVLSTGLKQGWPIQNTKDTRTTPQT